MDQPANAERLQKLGAGVMMKSKTYRADRVAAHIKELTITENVRATCNSIARKFAHDRPTEAASDLIESLWQKSQPNSA
jgi:UDP:flavonoid glycosyltransferase YjiC (YdhE family)